MKRPFSKKNPQDPALKEGFQQRRMYEAVLSSTPDFVYIFDLSHRFIYANKALLEMWGLTWEEAIGKNCPELGYEPWHARMHDREIEQVIATQKTVRGEVPFTGTRGRRIYDYIFVPVLDANGRVEAVAGTTRDVTDERGTRHAVRHLAAIVESSDDAIISKDLKGIITSWNRGAERIFGYKAGEVIGKSITVLIPKDRRNEEPAILQKIIQGEGIDHYDTVRRRKDGGMINVSLTISPIRDSHGVIGASKIARDITERKKAEKELKYLSSELEKRVEERTRALEDQTWRLRDLAVELTQVEQKERRRLAEVLHDHLQQYLVAAKMRIELCERKMSGNASGLQDARSHIDSAIDASRQLTAELRPPVLYEGGLNAGLRYLGQKMENQHHIRVHLNSGQDAEPGGDLVKVMLYQCVQELLFNTVKYARVPECFVTVHRLENRMIQVVVEDKGAGFDVSRIGSHDKGGFGLFSIRERIKALGGDFLMASTPGQGSSFTLNIPDKIEMATVEEIINLPAERVSSNGMSSKEGIVVLVADDHHIVRQSIASLLIMQPFIKNVIEAGNGEEAIRKAVSADPDIILMDINMPLVNGIEATQILSHKNSRSKVIGLSVQGEPEMAKTMQNAGAVAYFNKGDDTNSLIDTIKKFACQLTQGSSSFESN